MVGSNQCTIFETSQSIGGHRFMNIEILGAKIASAFKKIITNSHFKKRVSLEEQKAQMQDRNLRKRQIPYMIYEYFRVTGAHEAVLENTDLLSISQQGEDIPGGTWLSYQQVKFTEIVFWKICTRCEDESVINSEQYRQCTNKKPIKIDRSRKT